MKTYRDPSTSSVSQCGAFGLGARAYRRRLQKGRRLPSGALRAVGFIAVAFILFSFNGLPRAEAATVCDSTVASYLANPGQQCETEERGTVEEVTRRYQNRGYWRVQDTTYWRAADLSEFSNTLALLFPGCEFLVDGDVEGDIDVYSYPLILICPSVEEPAGVTVSPTQLRIVEGESVSYTVVLESAPEGTATISISVIPPALAAVFPPPPTFEVTVATIGSPPSSSTSLTFSSDNWRVPQTVTVSVVEDDHVSVVSEYTINHSVSGYGDVTEADDVTVYAVDNDVPIPVVSISPDSVAIDEGGTATFSLTASPPPVAPLAVSVTVGQTGDFAASGETGPRTVTIGTNGRGTLSVATEDDATDEPNGTITVTAAAGEGYVVSESGGSASMTVNDNDVPIPVISMSPSSAAIDEGGTATFSLSASPPPVAPLEVSVTVSQTGDFAASGATGPRTVTIGTNGRGTLSVATEDDATDEANGTITVTAEDGEGYDVSESGGSASMTVNDNDAPIPVISISPDSAAIDEGGTVTFSLSASPPPVSPLAVSVTVSQTGDFAASGATGSRTVTIGTNGRGTLSVATEDDATDEANGTITVTAAAGEGYDVSGSGGSASMIVNDNDAPIPVISISPSSAAIDEGGTATFSLSASPPPVAPLEVSVTVSQTGDFAPSGETGSRTVTVGTNGRGTISVATEDDATDEANGTITVTAAAGEGYYVAESGGSASMTVNDNDVPISVISITPDSDAIDEGGTATFSLTASPPPVAPLEVSVTVSQSGDFAASGETGSRTVTIGTDGRGTLSVATEDDATDEADGTITAITAAGQGYDVSESDGSASMTVNDNDVPISVISISPTSAAIDEGGTATFSLTASPPPVAPLEVSVTVSQTGDFAPSGETGSRTVTIGTDGTGSLTVRTVSDAAGEADGSITVAIDSGEAYSGSGSASLTVRSTTPPQTEEEQAAVTETVQAVTAATAANIAANIGTRFAAARSGTTVVVGGQPVSFGPVSELAYIPSAAERELDPFAEPFSAGHGRSLGVDEVLRSSAFEMSLNATDEESQGGVMSPQWTIWGRGDLQYFESLPERGSTYEGSLRAGYLGMDARAGDRWLFGLAASLTNTEADYALGDGSGGEGRLDARITGLHPYLRYSPDGSLELWSILGVGRGEIENERPGSAEREASDVDMRMAAAGARRNLVSDGQWNLALLGDVGIARVETEEGVQAIQGLSVDAWRARLGVEGSHTASLESGYAVTTFAEVAGRYDGGEDEDEVGLEVSPGVYVAGPSGFGVEVRGRMLALHTAENYEEYGASITLSMSPRPDGTGPSLSIRPRVGAGTQSADTLWREDPFALSSARSAEREALSLDVGMGYGMRAWNGLLTPFGELALRDEDSRRLRAGARFNLTRSTLGELSLELSGERNESGGRDPEHRVGVTGRLRF